KSKEEQQKGSFQRLVEVGRLVLINSGEYAGKLAIIVEIIDHNRVIPRFIKGTSEFIFVKSIIQFVVNLTLNLQALIDGPTTGVARHAYTFRRMTLTDFVVKGFPRGATSKILKKYLEKEDVLAKWDKSSWAKKLDDRKKRSVLTDFDRFKLLKLKKQRRFIVQSEIASLRKAK
ncbi:ribosomal protein L14-domain-containing protein, partial [Rhizophagus irregularis DAOM 181602=DAOM 197198]